MSGPDASPDRVSIDLSATCNIERCVLLGEKISFLFAILFSGSAVFSLIGASMREFTAHVFLVCVFVSLYSFLRYFLCGFNNRFVFAFGLVLVLLFYASWTAYVTATDWTESWPWWIAFLTLLPTTLQALSGLKSGALDVFSAARSYKRKWARNSSYRKFVFLRGLRHPAGVLYFAAALAIVLLIPVISAYAARWEATREFANIPLIPALIFAALWCYREGGRRSIARFIGSDADVPPSFTLYLRSFLDDQAKVTFEREIRLTRMPRFSVGIAEQLDPLLGYSNILEQVAVAALWPFDPVMCLGRTAMQPLGALRFEASEKDWQATVTRFCEAANRILLMFSTTSGLTWEYREAMSRKLHTKLLLILPPPELPHQTAAWWPKGSRGAEEQMSRWNASIIDTPLADVPLSLLETAIIIRFDEDGWPIILSSGLRSAVVYSVASTVACLPTSKLKQLNKLQGLQNSILSQSGDPGKGT